MDTITAVYSIKTHMSWCEGEDCWTDISYTSKEEAVKCLNALFHAKSKNSKEYSDVKMMSDTWFRYKINNFKYGNTCDCEIVEDEIVIKDKFSEEDLKCI